MSTILIGGNFGSPLGQITTQTAAQPFIAALDNGNQAT